MPPRRRCPRWCHRCASAPTANRSACPSPGGSPTCGTTCPARKTDWLRKYDIVKRAATDAGRDPADIETGITIERPLPETDAESAELHDLIARWHEIGVDHVVMDFGNPASTEPILRFAEQVIAPLR